MDETLKFAAEYIKAAVRINRRNIELISGNDISHMAKYSCIYSSEHFLVFCLQNKVD
jgi:hypothetical protein